MILVNSNTKVIVQGITGSEGSRHAQYMLQYGTKVVGGVTPGKGGQSVVGVPVFDSVEEAVAKTGANTSIIFVPAKFAADAAFEAIDAGLGLVVIITEHIPIHDALRFVNYAKYKGVTIVGPNCPGVVSPTVSKVGILPNSIYNKKGSVGIISRSGTLTYELSYLLAQAGYGQSTVVGVGGDPVTGIDTVETAMMFEKDNETKLIVAVGEIGGDAEERLAKAIMEGKITKPVVGFIAGRTAPPGKRMGHAGAIVSMGMGTYNGKVEALKGAGVPVAKTPLEVVKLVKEKLSR